LPLHALIAIQDLRRLHLAAVDAREVVREAELFDGLRAGERGEKDVRKDQQDDDVKDRPTRNTPEGRLRALGLLLVSTVPERWHLADSLPLPRGLYPSGRCNAQRRRSLPGCSKRNGDAVTWRNA